MKLTLHHEFYREQDGRWVQVWREGYDPRDFAAHKDGDRQSSSKSEMGGIGRRVRNFR
jgi:hypothetical protein